MSGAPINLNKVRKARARHAARQKADENAVRFGRTKAQKKAEDHDKARAARHLDETRRET